MAAPLRSWHEAVEGPEGNRWSVEVTVPYLDSTLAAESVQHVVQVRQIGLLRRRSVWREAVAGEAQADALLMELTQALRAGWRPDQGAPLGR